MRLTSLALAALALALAGGGCSRPTPPPATAGSLLLVTIDTWRADAFGAGGHPDVRSPALDRLFRNGRQFAETYSPVPTTLASHTSLLSGAWPTTHGVPANLWPVPEDVTTLAEILSDRGFATGAFLSSAALDAAFNLDQGFDKYNFKAVAFAEDDAPWRPGVRTLHRARTWWEEHAGERRFLWIHLWEPHFPYEPHPTLVKAYDPGYAGEANGSMEWIMQWWESPAPPPEADLRHVVALYHAEITGLDRALRLFLDLTDLDDTILVVTGDHGESLGEHNLTFKHGPNVFPADVQVPLALLAPGLAPGVSGAQVRTIDVPRAALRLLGLDESGLPEEAGNLLDWADGGRGLPVFGVATQPWVEMDDDVYPCTPLQRVVRTPEAAYVETPYRERTAWFDRRIDPGELVALPPPIGSTLPDSLRGELDRWIEAGTYRPDYRPMERNDLREQLRSLGYLE
jgi:arylsulfatase A-like enzyme